MYAHFPTPSLPFIFYSAITTPDIVVPRVYLSQVFWLVDKDIVLNYSVRLISHYFVCFRVRVRSLASPWPVFDLPQDGRQYKRSIYRQNVLISVYRPCN